MTQDLPASSGELPRQVLDQCYYSIASNLTPLTRPLVPDASAAVCGVVRASADSFIVSLAPASDLRRRYALRFPAWLPGRELVTISHVIDVLRRAEQSTPDGNYQTGTNESAAEFFGAPVFEASSYLETSRAINDQPAWPDALFAGLWSAFSFGVPATAQELQVTGFVQYEPEWFRLYIRDGGEPLPLGVDVPLFASAELGSELTVILRPDNRLAIDDAREEPDDFCAARFDLRSWFGR